MIFRDRLKNRFSDVLSTARTDAMNSAAVAGTRVDDRDYDAIKPYNPSWIDPSDWATMIDTKWKTDKWHKNEEINKKNKATLIDGEVAKHTSGSVSFELTKHRMEKETGEPVNSLDWYKECHLTRARKSSSLEDSENTSPKYVTPKAQKVAEYYEELLDDTYGLDRVNHPRIGDLKLWLKACGGMKKGRLFGYGAPDDPCLAVTGAPSAESTMTSDYSSMSSIAEVERLKTQLEERDKKAEERERAAEERERRFCLLK